MVNVLLFEFSADVNCRDVDLWTPLHTVALCGHTLIAQCLLDWYARAELYPRLPPRVSIDSQ